MQHLRNLALCERVLRYCDIELQLKISRFGLADLAGRYVILRQWYSVELCIRYMATSRSSHLFPFFVLDLLNFLYLCNLGSEKSGEFRQTILLLISLY